MPKILNKCISHSKQQISVAGIFKRVLNVPIRSRPIQLIVENYFIYFLQACFTRCRDHQSVDLNKISTNGEKILNL